MTNEILDKVISILDIRNKWFRVELDDDSSKKRIKCVGNTYHLCPIDKKRYYKIENNGNIYQTLVWSCDMDFPVYTYMKGMLEDIIFGRLEIIDRKDEKEIFGNYAYVRDNVNEKEI